MKAGAIAFLLAALLVPPAASADVVILNNGDRIEGEVISETSDAVSLRCRSGNIQYVQNIRRSTVTRIEKGDVDAAGESTAAHPATESSEPRTSAGAISDKPAFLKVTIAKWQAGKAAATGADLTRLINSSKPEELAELSEIVQKEMNTTLAEFAAQAHWTAATELGEKRPLRLPMATRYEARALAPRIQAAYEQAIKEEVHGKPDPRAKARAKVASKPAPVSGESAVTTQAAPPENPEGGSSAGSIAHWLESPNEFRADKAGATAMRTQLEYAMSLLNERMRIDPEVTSDRNLRMSLTGQRTRLAALHKAAQTQVAAGIAEEKAAQAEGKKQADEDKRRQRQAMLDHQRERQEEFRNRQVEQALKGAVPLQQAEGAQGQTDNSATNTNSPNNIPAPPPTPPQPQQK